MLRIAAAIALAGMFLSSTGCFWGVRGGGRGGYSESRRDDDHGRGEGRDEGRGRGDEGRGHDDHRP
jgi:hypothetical protein